MMHYGGMGAFIFRTSCNGLLALPGVNGNIWAMWNSYKHTNYVYKTLSPSEILSGPYINCPISGVCGIDCPEGLSGSGFSGYSGGVCSYINPLIPPTEAGSDFIKRTFLNVLLDSNATNTHNPWLYGSSTKWNPLCWESQSEFPAEGITQGGVFCFSGAEDPNIEGNIVKIIKNDDNLIIGAASVPVICNLFDCCPPPPE
jgi:hypothetical protein